MEKSKNKDIRKSHKSRKQKVSFIGRQEQINKFRENLKRPEEERCFLFNIYGQGGVGKSKLIRKFREIAIESGFSTALAVDTQTDVPKVLEQLAHDLEDKGHKFKSFSDRFRLYQQLKGELESDPEAPHGFISLLGSSLTKAATGYVKQTSVGGAITAVVDEEMLAAKMGELASYFRKRKWNVDDVALINDPIAALTPIFLDDLHEISQSTALVLFFDVKDTSIFLDDWLWALLEEEYGNLPFNSILVVAAREALKENAWMDYGDAISWYQLEPFSKDEAKQYLSHRGITNPKVIETIIYLSGCLPVLINTLLSKRTENLDRLVDPSSTAVKHFLDQVDDLGKREVALAVSLSRLFNREIIEILHDKESANELFEWLKSMPFVEEEQHGWAYHEVVRSQMMRQQYRLSPNASINLHKKLSHYYEDLCTNLGLEPRKQWNDYRWQTFFLHQIYHHLCFAQTQALPNILSNFLIALTYKKYFSQQYVQTIVLAGKDTNSGEIESIGHLLTNGLNAFERGEYEIGIEMFTPMLDKYELEPESRAVALSWRGEAYRLMRKYDEAISDFNAAILLKPDNVWTIVCRSSAYRKLKRYAQALEDCNRAIELEPENSWAYNSRGETHLSMRRYEEALRDFDRSVDIDPSNSWGIASRAKAYRIMHRTQDALKEFNRAIELDPTSSWALASRGLTHRQMGNYEESIADFNQALTLDTDSSWVLASRGETYRQIGQYDRALEDFNHAVEIDPSNAWALCRKAEICLFLKRYEESFNSFELSLALQPNNDWRRFSYSLALKRAGDLEAAQENLEIAIDIIQRRRISRPKDYRSCLTLALYCLANEAIEKSQKLYKEALASDNLPTVSIRESIRGLEDFLRVFPEHQQGIQIREQLLLVLQSRKESQKN